MEKIEELRAIIRKYMPADKILEINGGGYEAYPAGVIHRYKTEDSNGNLYDGEHYMFCGDGEGHYFKVNGVEVRRGDDVCYDYLHVYQKINNFTFGLDDLDIDDFVKETKYFYIFKNSKHTYKIQKLNNRVKKKKVALFIDGKEIKETNIICGAWESKYSIFEKEMIRFFEEVIFVIKFRNDPLLKLQNKLNKKRGEFDRLLEINFE
jgi:hypothetical protein